MIQEWSLQPFVKLWIDEGGVILSIFPSICVCLQRDGRMDKYRQKNTNIHKNVYSKHKLYGVTKLSVNVAPSYRAAVKGIHLQAGKHGWGSDIEKRQMEAYFYKDDALKSTGLWNSSAHFDILPTIWITHLFAVIRRMDSSIFTITTVTGICSCSEFYELCCRTSRQPGWLYILHKSWPITVARGAIELGSCFFSAVSG